MADGAAELCVCVLFYGADEYCSRLAQRVLNKPMRELAHAGAEFRFGFNAVSDETRKIARSFIETESCAAPVVVDSEKNIYKYPMMRRLFYEQNVKPSITMWFDDNSYIDPSADTAVWLNRVCNQLRHCAILGSVYTAGLVGNQAGWIQAQPWFNGKPPAPYVQYVAGGWWAAQTDVLKRFDWPSTDIKHYGGDVMLGELVRQQDLQLCHFRDNVMIQANEVGVESAGPRRGFDAPPVGFDYGT